MREIMKPKIYWWETARHGRTGEPVCWDCAKKLKNQEVNRFGIVIRRRKAPKEVELRRRRECSAPGCGEFFRARISDEV